MALRANAQMIFAEYTVGDDGTSLTFRCPDPGPGQPSYYVILLTDAELAAVSTQQQLHDLIVSKLQRKFRASLVASKLDQFIGQSVTI